jgi:hypothetical protein
LRFKTELEIFRHAKHFLRKDFQKELNEMDKIIAASK